MFAAHAMLLTPPAGVTQVQLIGTPNAAVAGSVTIPAHQVGDIIEIYAYNAVSNFAPSKPAAFSTTPDFTYIDNPTGANSNGSTTARFVATATNHTSGTWGSASAIIASVWRGQHTTPEGGHAESGSTSTSGSTAPSVTLTNTDGSSQLVHYGGRRDSDWTAWGSTPAGYTLQASVGSGATGVFMLTKDDTTSDGSVTMPTNGSTSIGYRGATVEIRQH